MKHSPSKREKGFRRTATKQLTKPAAPPLPHLIHFPAPSRESVELGNGRYFTRPWTLRGVDETINAGGYFEVMTGRHEFERNSGARALALKHWSRLPRDSYGMILKGRRS